jgi:primase-polymerase (primpol)-like protein
VAQGGGADGIGLALLGTSYDVVDLDHCRDPDTGAIDAWADIWVHQANGAYVEKTPSGEGLRIIGLGKGGKLQRRWKIKGWREKAGIEVYRNCERYITITGAPIGDCTALAPTNGLLEKIQAHYDGKNGASDSNGAFDYNKAGKQAGSLDYDAVRRLRQRCLRVSLRRWLRLAKALIKL